jgi:hypothetical protein
MVRDEDDYLVVMHEKRNLGRLATDKRFQLNSQGVPKPAAFSQENPDDYAPAILQAFKAAADNNDSVYANLAPGAYCAQAVLERFPHYPKSLHGSKGRKIAAKAITALKSSGALKHETYTRAGRKRGERLVLAKSAPVVSDEGAE